MLADSPVVSRLVEAFRRLPGIGKRTAERLAYHLLSAPETDAHELSEAVMTARRAIKRCAICRNLTDIDPCRICQDDRRDHTILCVVEYPAGATAVERGGAFRGVYHVLHGVINPLDGIGPDELAIHQLVKRISDSGITEAIIATNTTVEGENTAMYLARLIAPLGVRVSRIAHGVPMGGGLEYADDATLAHALQGRTVID